MSNKYNIMLVEDHVGYRTTLIRALKCSIDIGCIHEFSTAEVALRKLEQMGAEETPDILLLDLNLPGMTGIESISWFNKYSEKLKIIILTQSMVEEDILAAMSAGASGYLLKSSTVTQISEAIQSVLDGGASIDPKMAKFILKQIELNSSKKPALKKTLSDRELEILQLLAQGKVRKEISQELDITINTVAYHVDHIYEKLEVVNAPAAVAKGFRSGLL
ncbi:response regulator transcription factor [Pelagicoccus sp. SDUM812005]|uniref:response regulator transcription factor n=1 Tax=Pelagicoccus sp. SDUM812005 TaxID=3041257 RepID=UPI00280C5A0B|nr:response regulator transcription factor [Pelagicoccus sp. SDUM812005]MDQ8179547.1 response regulator transcription factor [Pelagicoccus sp. SDUM812005]